MQLARIDGTVTAPVGHPSLRGARTVICQPLGADGTDLGDPVLALDPLGAGLHQLVFFTTDGAAARAQVRDPRSPLRNCVLALADTVSP